MKTSFLAELHPGKSARVVMTQDDAIVLVFEVTRQTLQVEFVVTGKAGFQSISYRYQDASRSLRVLGAPLEFLSLASTASLPFVADHYQSEKQSVNTHHNG